MKYFNKFWLGAIALALLASCEKESLLDYPVEKPESLARLEYLNDYDVLKSYVESPDFKLGAGVSVDQFNEKGLVYSHIVSNFNEVTAGWEMKHSAIVQDNGSLNLARVENFINTAQEAGVTIYGHTLTWHTNQNAKYLNSTIAPTVIPAAGGPGWVVVTENDFETDDASNYTGNTNAVMSFTADGEGAEGTGRALKITNSAVRTNDWDSQFFITFEEQTEEGEKYMLTMDVRADANATFPTQAHVVPYQYKHWDFFGSISATTEWTTYTKEIMIADNTSGVTSIAFNLGATATSYYFDNIKLEKYSETGGGGPTWDEQEANDFETDDDANYVVLSNAQTSSAFTSAGEGAEGDGRALIVTNSAVGPNPWSSQLFFRFSDEPAEEGDQYELTMDIRSDAPATVGTQAQNAPGGYLHWDLFGAPAFTTEWANYTRSVTISGSQVGATWIAFNLGDVATSYYFDNVRITKYNPDGGQEQIIEMTPEEKADTIASELERFIAGTLEVTKGYVKAWDVVNEPMDDGNPSELKTGVGKAKLAADEFYWQDYLGKDYAVMAFNLARQYGNQDDILFINDYNLEYNLDKCRGLIQYVEYIESKGAEVDGIGTQMHISIDSDKDKIVEMFELLAATGKLIKVSELDLGVGVSTSEATDEHYIAQEEMYKFVVEKYLEIIPANQQYGITIWSPLDSPAGSSWRAGEPIGLWTEGYYRKRAYAGVADGLSGN